MCDCVKKMEDKIKQEVHTRFSKPNKPVQHFHIRATMSGRPIVNISIFLAKQIKSAESFIVADFCPWCGTKYE